MSDRDDDGFVVPPPGITQQPTAREEPQPEPVDPVDMISLPPGLVDSGTYRVQPSRVQRPPQPAKSAPTFVPNGAPALPSPTPVAESVVDDATRASVGRRVAESWRLTLPGGEQVLVEQTILVGRDPAHSAQWSGAALLAVTDSAKTVSKTHAVLELTPGGQMVVHDLDSTNGVYLGYNDDDEVTVEPGEPVLVEPGASLSLGEFTVAVERF